jgi:Fe-S cluster assembly iron-binding protein IscA
MSFHVTGAAAQEILAAAGRSGAAGMALRVAARRTPEGIAYDMGFDEAVPDDEVAVFDGLTVLVAAASRPLLAQTVLDYVELDAGERDFIFVSPQQGGCATQARQCGSGGCSGCA